MTLIHDQLAVVADAIVNNGFLDEALDDRHVDEAGRPGPSAADATDRRGREVEEPSESLDPLVKELSAVTQYGTYCLAEGCRRRQHARVVRQHRLSRHRLLRAKLTFEARR